MSRSNPTENNPNPCTRWFEWNGETGTVRYYDKEKRETVDVGRKFNFILLDTLATIKGWNDASESGIFSNEVRDTRDEPFVVKAFKGGTLAEGIYKQIRDRVAAAGGQFVANCYIAYKIGNDLQLGSIQFKGATLGSWMEFEKAHRADLLKKAVAIVDAKEGKKGRIVFQTPIFALKDITPETDAQAIEIDKALQTYLKAYFKRTRVVQAEQQMPAHEDENQEPPEERTYRERQPDPFVGDDDDDIPF